MKKKKFMTIYPLVLVAILTMNFLFNMTHKNVVVSGDSMLPTLRDGQIVLSSQFKEAVPGRIYLIEQPEDTEFCAIKRLIGVPGDKIELKDGATYRNGSLMMEAPGDSWDNQSWDLGPNEYLFIGDNRSVSYDGRFWSRCLTLEEIKYQLDYIIYPFSSIGKVGSLEDADVLETDQNN